MNPDPLPALAMQYRFELPDDFDMTQIRNRVAERGPAFDDFAGLVQKAFLIAERARGAAKNLYAPFYVWRDAGAMLDFLAGDKFKAVTGAFGWPPVACWTTLEFGRGKAQAAQPRVATRELIGLPAGADLAALRAGEAEAQRRTLDGAPGLYSRLIALDPSRWQVVRFSLWTEEPAGIAVADTYEVLHLSEPR